MVRVQRSSVIAAPVEQVWARIRDFDKLPDWHPAFVNSHIEDGKASDQVGCVRNFHLADGGNLRERLLAFSDVDTYTTYAILDSPLPIVNYVSTLRLRPITDGDRTFVEWTCTFDVEADQKDAMQEALAGVYDGGFAALKAHFGG
jgi:hypothetical protein